jgi:hypothetical protein
LKSIRYRLLLVLCVLLAATLVPSAFPARAEDYVARAYDKSAPFGIVSNLGNRVRDDEQDAAVALMREAGIQWAREELSWERLQTEKGGPFLWSGTGNGFYNYDRSIERLHNANINVLGLLSYNPAWFKSKNPTLDEWITDWGDYVYNTVARYGRDRGQIKYWEIWNEPNLRKFGYENTIYTVQDYVRLLDVARAAAKAADPEAVIVLGGIASIWGEFASPEDYDVPTYLRMLYDAGGWNSFDVLAIHPYRPGAPEASSWRRDTAQDFEAELRIVDGLLAEFGTKPVWLTEVSWSSYDGYYGVSELDQAAYLQRMYLLAMSHPTIQRVFWYDLRNDTAPSAPYTEPVYETTEPEFHFGLMRRSYPLDADRADLRKPAFAAYRALTNILGDMRQSSVLAYGDNPEAPGMFGFRYDGNGRSAIVLWRVSAEASPQISVQCDCRDVRIRQWDGKLLGIVQARGMLTVRLDAIGLPVYVEWGPDRVGGGQFFEETNHAVPDTFLRYWRENGGAEQFGYPLTGALLEAEPGTNKPRLVQHFERARFEEQPTAPDGIGLGRLGDEMLRRMNVDWRNEPRIAEPSPDCAYFGDTGHQICAPFRAYWEANGGVARFGMPLTEAFEENGLTVQYFEYARIERHPGLAGTADELQVGLLGRNLLVTRTAWP